MRIPVRAVYTRSQKGRREEFKPQMIGAEYADIPDELMLGTLAQCARSGALHAQDDEAVGVIDRAIEKACAAGKMMTMD